ncbi:hypothetical protein BDQ17DRAFT_1326780 [Cyathus striatus]|nr:hypothetical protein BDQ17DRAFT_1326780 [Cyathus striatus]
MNDKNPKFSGGFIRVKYLMQIKMLTFRKVLVLTKILIIPIGFIIYWNSTRAVESLVRLYFNLHHQIKCGYTYSSKTFSFLKMDETIWVIWVWALQRLIEIPEHNYIRKSSRINETSVLQHPYTRDIIRKFV